MPELISDQYVFIHPTQTDGRSHLSFDLHLKGYDKRLGGDTK